MGESWKRLVESAKSTWQKLTPTTRLLVGFGAAALLGTAIILSLTGSRVNYVPLYTGLAATDAGEVIGRLKEAGIPYRLEAGGSAVLVPAANVYETRLQLATQGIPKNGVVGFELFNDTKLGSTDFERKLKYNWALQGELTRTIREMSEVEDARVHIVLAEPSLFVSEKRDPTASVLLKLRANGGLSEEQVRGIANLVAGSVEGLKPENVTILDQDGNVLSDLLAAKDTAGGYGVGGGDAAWRLAFERKAEQELEKSVQTMLERVFGWGHAVARVNAQYDFNYQESSEEQFSPVGGDTGILRSEQQTQESYQGSGASGAGVPGVASNVPGYATSQTGGGGSSTYSRTDATRNYEVNKRSTRSVTAPGRIQRLSVAVWVDGNLTPQQRQSVEAAVATAVGLDQSRGDQLTVESMKFEKPPELQFPSQAPGTQPGGIPAWAWAAATVAAAAGVFIALRRRGRGTTTSAPGAGVDILVGGAAQAPGPSAPTEEAVPLLTPDHDAQRIERSVERLAKEKPEQVAQLLRTWLTEEERS